MFQKVEVDSLIEVSTTAYCLFEKLSPIVHTFVYQVAVHVEKEALFRIDAQLLRLMFYCSKLETGRVITSCQNATICKVTQQRRITC
jgi:hypothetical protein